MSKTIAILNQKGGVGKTTTAINVAAYLAKGGSSVLLVDLDPQGNATSGLGVDKHGVEGGTYDVLFNPEHFATYVQETSVDNLYLLPTNEQLAALEVEFASREGREQALKNVLSSASYDYILIDCPPALGLLTVNALTAARYVLIPVQAEYYAMEGLGQLLQVFQRVKQNLNPSLEILGVVMTMFDTRTSLSNQVTQEVKKYFDNKLLPTAVPRNVRLAEAPSYGKPIATHDKWSKGARAYRQLTKEIVQRIS